MSRAVAVLLAAPFLLLAPGALAHGMLLPRDSGEPLAIRFHRVDIRGNGGTAVTKVEQVFVNRTGQALEATYLFPLPADAVLLDFRLSVNGEMKKGEVLAKEKAEAIYQDIVRRMKDPGLLDWMGPNLFRCRIYPVPARGEQRIEVTYTQVLPVAGGTYKLVHPLRTPGRASQTLEDFTLTARLSHPTPLKAIYSPTHRISVQRKGEHDATIGFEDDSVVLDTDFVLYFGVSEKAVGLQVLTYRPPGESGYFLALASPGVVFQDGERPRKAITFVLDTSGSMAGRKMEDAKKALLYGLEQLGPEDLFQVVRFSSDVEALSDRLLPGEPANLAEARAFVRSFEAAGGTAIEAALEEALRAEAPEGLPHVVLFVTDGRPTVGETARDKIVSRAKAWNEDRSRLFAFGVGDEVDALLLDRLAAEGGGTSAYVKGDEDLDVQIAGIYEELSHPVLTHLSLDIDHVGVHQVLPGRLPDLFKGRQLVVVGRYRHAADALIRLSGRMKGERRSWDFEATFPERSKENSFLAALWADRQVGFLLDEIRQKGETRELRDEVVQLATRYGIVTPYTSYLVVEDDRDLGGAAGPPPVRDAFRIEPRSGRTGAFGGSGTGGGGFGLGSRGRGGDVLEGEMRREEAAEAMKKAFRPAEPSPAAPPATAARDIAESKGIRHLKAKQTAEGDSNLVRRVGGVTLRFRDGAWVDTRHRSGMKTLRVAPYSEAWLDAVRAVPRLKEVLSVGERVTVVVGEVALEVDASGKRALAAEDFEALKE